MQNQEHLETLLQKYEKQVKPIIVSGPISESKESLLAMVQQYRAFLHDAARIVSSYYQSSYNLLSGVVGIAGGLAGTIARLWLPGTPGLLVGFSAGFMTTFFAVRQGIEYIAYRKPTQNLVKQYGAFLRNIDNYIQFMDTLEPELLK